MAQKARFFKVTIRDGHGDNFHYYPAHSKDDLLNSLRLLPTEKLISVDHIGWFDVSVSPDEYISNVIFIAKIDIGNVFFERGDLGYEYLWQLFPKKAAKEIEFIEQYDGPR